MSKIFGVNTDRQERKLRRYCSGCLKIFEENESKVRRNGKYYCDSCIDKMREADAKESASIEKTGRHLIPTPSPDFSIASVPLAPKKTKRIRRIIEAIDSDSVDEYHRSRGR